MNGESSFDELIGVEKIGREWARLRDAQLEKAASVGVTRLRWRWVVKRRARALLLLAAALSIAAVFVSGYAVGDHQYGSGPKNTVVRKLVLRGTSIAPHARATLDVWNARGRNSPMTLRVLGLPKLPPHTYYEVDLVRGGKPWGSCGTFRIVSASHAVTLTLNAPFALRKRDSWVVTRQALGRESGVTALRPV